jgi:CubicO group peptidase (beta-lactamase class C family)
MVPASTAAGTLHMNMKRLERLDQFIKKVTEDGTHPSSVVRVLHHGSEVYSGAYGVAAPEGAPLAMDAIFPVASVTKPVVATLLAILQEEGVIDFCDRLNRYYPAFKGGLKDSVELWQLLCHSSGMSDEAMQKYVPEFIKDNLGIELPENCSYEEYGEAVLKTRGLLGLPEAEGPAAVGEAETLIKLKAPLGSEPHTAFNYCSMGYVLLGKLIEKLTGEDIDSYAARRLFKPLGMEDTHFNLPKEKWHRVVKRNPSFCFADWLNSEFILTDTNGAGGLKSTVPDLTKLGQMYLQEGAYGSAQILAPLTVRLLTSNHNSRLPDSFWFGRILGSAWGLGWHVRCGKKDDLGLLRSDRTYDHGGAGGARLVIDPDHGLVFGLYMVDQEPFDAYPNHSRVANIIYSALVK